MYKKSSTLFKSGLLKKVIAGYILIIVIPSILLGLFIYDRFYSNMIGEYIKQKQQILNEYYSSMENDLTKIQGVSSLFQYNTNVIDYLDGKHTSDLDEVYTYSKFIRPIFNYAFSSMPSIQDIKIYKSNGNVLSVPSEIVNIVTMEDAKVINDISSSNGLWICQQDNSPELPKLKFYQKIYNYDLLKGIGIIEVVPNTDILYNYLNNISSLSKGNDGIYLVDMKNNLLYKAGEYEFKDKDNNNNIDELFKFSDSNGYFHIKDGRRDIIGNVINIKALNVKTIVLEDLSHEPKFININGLSIFIYVLGLIVVLSAIYYFIAANMTGRMIKLAKHMRNVDELNLSTYTGKSGRDEIGFLIESYNSMIVRIDELINTVHRAELMRKEAAYAALQAQIRPHFLFGTLESIRMLAESNKDYEVSNIIFTFGRLMRYSLSSAKNEVSLEEELENVKNYFTIQKIRMGERLNYDINIDTDIRGFYCPRFILQPLAENSIVHGISQCRGQGLINIVVSRCDDYIIIKIIDNGYGIPHDKQLTVQSLLENKIDIKDFQTENSGFGVYSVSERIKSYYGKDSRLEIDSTLFEGTTCTLYLYYKKEGAEDENIDC